MILALQPKFRTTTSQHVLDTLEQSISSSGEHSLTQGPWRNQGHQAGFAPCWRHPLLRVLYTTRGQNCRLQVHEHTSSSVML